ncbi:hypothetical protein Trichorick_01313 [Candidatus Trichorickettsia mobilis]|uniref:Uncharacterized protein n=1 Tax=Candidatus Trichorickettsia mobilis TaxID=1346319 RepID=A0ABZ0UUB1_9RICK|nr:hypothetical protein [Candidatus Trichorickettsia mobilis]WPY01401.1 hypothetical protein Trichorick_01313 [Candidatus Trichorickettsia mobilis]
MTLQPQNKSPKVVKRIKNLSNALQKNLQRRKHSKKNIEQESLETVLEVDTHFQDKSPLK